MGNVYACVGRYAVTPYTIKKSCINIYCVEELCYYIQSNAYFIDDDFFDADLFAWLEEECSLGELSKTLKQKARIDKHVENIVRCLLENIHYCDESEIAETEKLLKANRKMPGKQKLKLRGDYFLMNNQYALAMRTYEELLLRLDDSKDISLTASVYHNIAVIYAKMFLFDEAAELFDKAFMLDGDEKHRVCQLAAYKMTLSDNLFMKRVNALGDVYNATSVLEENYSKALADLKNSDDYLRNKGMEHFRAEGNIEEYHGVLDQQIEYFKTVYRQQLKI